MELVHVLSLGQVLIAQVHLSFSLISHKVVPNCVTGTSSICDISEPFVFSPTALEIIQSNEQSCLSNPQIIDNYILTNSDPQLFSCQSILNFTCKVLTSQTLNNK